tara:strand:- start:167 stop:496 length:330 start_codon:yes stop_codon:yes gene_type:complete
MAGYLDWMNPNPQAAHADRLLNDPRNPTILAEGSFQPTRETLPATPLGTTDEFINGQWVPRDGFQPEVLQTQRPARPVVPFPEGESLNRTPIANSFIDRIKSMFNRGSF